jgi:hypothetical protein
MYWNILTMHVAIKVKSPNNISEWQMGFNSAFKGLSTVDGDITKPFLFPSVTSATHIDDCRTQLTPFCTDSPFTLIHPHSRTLTRIWFIWHNSPQWARASSFTRFLDHTQRRTTVGRTPLEEWSARRRYLYLKTRDTHNRRTPMPPVGFEPTTSAGERLQTHAFERATT